MASSAPRGNGLKPARLFRLIVLATGLFAILPAAAHAQDLTAERAFLSARDDYTAAVNARDLAHDRNEEALDEVDEARDSGDDARFERALAVYQQTAEELELRDRLLREAVDRLEQARREHLANVEDRLEGLYEAIRLVADESPDYNRIRREIDNLNYVANQLTRPVEINDDPFPEIIFDPGDSPAETRAKADLLDIQAARAERMILDFDEQIESYEKRLRHARMSQDFGADLFRFDDLRLPVGTPGAASVDSVGLRGNEELSRLLEDLYGAREQMIERRDIAQARAVEFRQRGGGIR